MALDAWHASRQLFFSNDLAAIADAAAVSSELMTWDGDEQGWMVRVIALLVVVVMMMMIVVTA